MKNLFYSKLLFVQKNTVVFKNNTQLLIKGPLGVSFLELPETIFFEKTNRGYRLFGLEKDKNLVLTHYKLFFNKLRGVYLGFFEILTVAGVGWRVSLKEKNTLYFSLGFSHVITYTLKENVEFIYYNKQCFKIFGLDLNAVQQTVADLCKLRVFDVYKGKGIYKQGQVLKLKESSKVKA